MALPVGTAAPDFVLKSSAEGFPEVRLSDHFGKRNAVLLFFPAAFSGVCTEEMCRVGSSQFFAADAHTAVIGVSVDSPFALAAWARKEGISATLLSDYAHTTIRAYDVALPNFAGTGGEAAARAVFVIDRAGVIRHAQQTATPGELPDFEAVRRVLEGIE